MKKLALVAMLVTVFTQARAQRLQLNDLEYFESQGVNVLVYNNFLTGGFNDEKNAGIEMIHHGVRTAQGRAVRLSNTPEQWDLVPEILNRRVDRAAQSIEATLRYKEYDFESRVVVTAKENGVDISIYLDKPVPPALQGAVGPLYNSANHSIDISSRTPALTSFPRFPNSARLTDLASIDSEK